MMYLEIRTPKMCVGIILSIQSDFAEIMDDRHEDNKANAIRKRCILRHVAVERLLQLAVI